MFVHKQLSSSSVNYAQPDTIDEALGLLAGESWAILAGGTDFYPAMLERSCASHIMDLHNVDELRDISLTNGQVRIGAGATWSDVIAKDLPASFEALKLAAREVGSVQIQNRATLVGNLCNASPAADGVPPLLVLDAQVELASIAGRRQMPLQQFILGNRQTARRPDEIVSAVLVSDNSTRGQSTFWKLGARKYLIISISMVAARLVVDAENIITEAAVSVGSCSLVACRMSQLETALIGQPLSDDVVRIVNADQFACLSPIDDVRSSKQYRMNASLELVRRSLRQLAVDVA